MGIVRLLTIALLSIAVKVFMMLPAPNVIAVAAGLVAGSCLLGEYLLPILSHLSPERFELDRRVAEVLETLESPQGRQPPQGVRVFVLDEDVPVMTWVGFRTVLVARGCYNLRQGDFRCALQEAYEQRLSLRSFMLLIATLGNGVFLGCRLFALLGRFFFRLIGALAGTLFGGQYPHRRARMGAAVGDALYRAFSFLFIIAGNLTVFVIYGLPLIWGDLAVDRALCGRGMAGSLRRLIQERRSIRYNGHFLREYALILRPPADWRLQRIENMTNAPAGLTRAPGQTPSGTGQTSLDGGDDNARLEFRVRGQSDSGLIVPDGLRRAGEQTERRRGGDAGEGMHIVRVTRRDQR